MRYPKHLKSKTNILPRVVEIISIENDFKVILRWNTEEIKVIDFEKHYFTKWKESNHPFFSLTKWENFKQVIIGEDKTLYWENQELAIDPDVLYDISEILSKMVLLKLQKEHTEK